MTREARGAMQDPWMKITLLKEYHTSRIQNSRMRSSIDFPTKWMTESGTEHLWHLLKPESKNGIVDTAYHSAPADRQTKVPPVPIASC